MTMLDLNQIYLGDCLNYMELIDDNSIDMVLCDLPYGTTTTTKCKWDSIIPFELLWTSYKRIIRKHGAIVLFCVQPFTSTLIISNLTQFKYCWTWDKITAKGHLMARKRPMRQTEDIAVFGEDLITYYPQMIKRDKPKKAKEYKRSEMKGGKSVGYEGISTHFYPKTLLIFKSVPNNHERLHPTQKPVDLCEYLIRTYTKADEIILDNCAGSGTVAIACLNTNRNFILIEQNPEYVKICENRIKQITTFSKQGLIVSEKDISYFKNIITLAKENDIKLTGSLKELDESLQEERNENH